MSATAMSFATEVIAKRASRSRPGWGLVSMRSIGRNQAGEDVISFVGHVFVESRGQGCAGTRLGRKRRLFAVARESEAYSAGPLPGVGSTSILIFRRSSGDFL